MTHGHGMTPIRRIKKADERAVTTEMTKNSASFWRHLRSCDYAFREFRYDSVNTLLKKIAARAGD